MKFYKYQGTGNDFVLLDNRKQEYSLTSAQIKYICDRHFGVGADGLMLLENQDGYDFKMVYYNSDGNESTMCGNGGRCISAFAKKLGLVSTEVKFMAIDGEHASFFEDEIVSLKMNDVQSIKVNETYFQLNTGSPHYVHFTEYVDELDVKKEGKLIRYSPMFKEEGINVNFVEKLNEHTIFVRTYERGVEDETLSCGTGVTASAISFIVEHFPKPSQNENFEIFIETLGGELSVKLESIKGQSFENIWLKGQAEFIFEGEINI
jgi:diaminopimelate epimerase